MNKRILSVIVFSAALLSVQAQDGKGGISPAMLGRIQQSYRGTPSDKAILAALPAASPIAMHVDITLAEAIAS